MEGVVGRREWEEMEKGVGRLKVVVVGVTI